MEEYKMILLGETKYKDIIKKSFKNFEKFELNLNYFNHTKEIICIIFLVHLINQTYSTVIFHIYLKMK